MEGVIKPDLHHITPYVTHVMTFSIYFACFYCIMKYGIILLGGASYSKKDIYFTKENF
jgi:hypothetical protein